MMYPRERKKERRPKDHRKHEKATERKHTAERFYSSDDRNVKLPQHHTPDSAQLFTHSFLSQRKAEGRWQNGGCLFVSLVQ